MDGKGRCNNDDGGDKDDDGGDDDDEFDLCVMLAGRWWSDIDKWAGRRSDYLTVVLSQSQSSDSQPSDDDEDKSRSFDEEVDLDDHHRVVDFNDDCRQQH